jgi:uncharacterized protein
MKPEKPKKAKAPDKRTRARAKEESSGKEKAEPAKAKGAGPLKKARTVVTRLKAAIAPATKSTTAQPAKVTPVKAAVAASRTRRGKLAVPPILLEGDAPSIVRPSGPGQRYEIGAAPPSADTDAMELPEAYGTQRLLLMARDPHWLYVHWDMTTEQLRQHNKQSRDGHLVVRIFRDQPAGAPVVEQHVHPESRNWFVHVGRGGTKYVAQLGYYTTSGDWNSIVVSGATFTPPDLISDDTSVRFETIPIEVPFTKLLELVRGAVAEHTPLVEVLEELRAAGHAELPRGAHAAGAAPWTPEQERALAQVVSIDEVRRVWMGSLEITELIRRSLEMEISSQAAAALARGEAVAPPGGIFSVSSPFGGAEKRKGFWFNVNAELIIYGATEPDASVTIGGRTIQLRRDGTFSFRFALPDGSYELPVQATSADGDDERAAHLSFRRGTEYRGNVGVHPQDARLKSPRAEHVS